MPRFAPSIVLFEKAPRWESELKRRFDARQVLVRPCRSAADALALCRNAPHSLLVADFDADAAEGLRLLESLMSARVPALALVIGSVETAALEWPARELGAVDFITDRTNGDSLAALCRRILTATTP